MNRLALALALLVAAAPATAAVVTVRYDFPDVANMAASYGWFGGDWGQISEGEILSTTVVIADYTSYPGQDASEFYVAFDVPATGAQTQVRITGASLGWSGAGVFNHSVTTDAYNGPIRPGRFGAEYVGGGDFASPSYIEFTVDAVLPDPLFGDGFDDEWRD
ncbi:hypothetical protein ACQQ2N_09660 [Dokdonella sp. MW10]|uniref:hypothetical protein n=1 Tax=Dokdonella sp. MW10 TaxID=2992926 RepID=UPI003F803CC7